jgi:N-formylglutamate deformylase
MLVAMTLPFFVSIPHSGEKIPDVCDWLKNLPEEILMDDVDRYVDFLYLPSLQKLKILAVFNQWHRYPADLNRLPEDVDASSVEGNGNPVGTHPRGFHWVITTHKDQLMKKPMSQKLHNDLVKLVYDPFHQEIRKNFQDFENLKYKNIYHLDLHSMPSLGTSQHRDPGETRAEIVISDQKGKSARSEFVELAVQAYKKAGFQVKTNWPYFGGRITEQYGEPQKGHHTVQVEMNRSLYMDEKTKKLKPELAQQVQSMLLVALEGVQKGLGSLL